MSDMEVMEVTRDGFYKENIQPSVEQTSTTEEVTELTPEKAISFEVSAHLSNAEMA